ncbi:hypothetical protein F4861DRAFT_542278 [Xylaria intraflava]|nr:hypothetical protein F4861DRAFT_542278 [Xylaria intraflava]
MEHQPDQPDDGQLLAMAPPVLDPPTWSMVDIIGRNVIMSELTTRSGSFQYACGILGLSQHEALMFLRIYCEDRAAHAARVVARDTLGQRNVVVPETGENLAAPRFVYIPEASIALACEFLEAVGCDDYVDTVWQWADTKHKLATDCYFDGRASQFASQRTEHRPTQKPKSPSTDEYSGITRQRHPSNTYGPRGAKLMLAGRYHVCWPVDINSNDEYNDFVIARNSARLGSASEHQLESLGSMIYHGSNAANGSAQRVQSVYQNPFLAENAPQGASRRLELRSLQNVLSNWDGEVAQFRLPPGYTLLGPQGKLSTFEPGEFQVYDGNGTPGRVGGTYRVVLPRAFNDHMMYEMEDLPDNVAFRFKANEKLVVIRNGNILPRFEQAAYPGVLDNALEHVTLPSTLAGALDNMTREVALLADILDGPEQVAQPVAGVDNRQKTALMRALSNMVREVTLLAVAARPGQTGSPGAVANMSGNAPVMGILRDTAGNMAREIALLAITFKEPNQVAPAQPAFPGKNAIQARPEPSSDSRAASESPYAWFGSPDLGAEGINQGEEDELGYDSDDIEPEWDFRTGNDVEIGISAGTKRSHPDSDDDCDYDSDAG